MKMKEFLVPKIYGVGGCFHKFWTFLQIKQFLFIGGLTYVHPILLAEWGIQEFGKGEILNKKKVYF